MTTPYRHGFVSIAAAITITLALVACAPATSRVPEGASHTDARPIALRFENEATEHVHVYLIGTTRQWLLGRIEPGGIASLPLPGDAFDESATFVRLAVLTGERITQQAVRHPRVTLTLAQPTVALLTQRWKFAQGELTSVRR